MRGTAVDADCVALNETATSADEATTLENGGSIGSTQGMRRWTTEVAAAAADRTGRARRASANEVTREPGHA